MMTWLQQLQDLYAYVGRPTYRSIAENAGISHTYASGIMQGKFTPSIGVLHRVVSALTDDWDVKNEIISAYEDENPVEPADVKPPVNHRPTERDFHALTTAINQLTEKIDEYLQETRRSTAWPDHH